MSQQYRICHNCGASLTPDQTYCPHCGATYIEPIVQQPGEFEPFPPEQPAASSSIQPYAAEQPVVLPPPQPQVPYPPSAPSPYPPTSYGQQTPVTPESGQVDGSTQPPGSQNGQGLRISVIIGAVVVLLLLLGGVGGLFYYLGQQNGSTPGTTPTPGVTPTPTPTPTPGVTPTPTPTPTPGVTPTPTPTPATTPTTVSFRTPATGIAVIRLSIDNASSSSVPKTRVNTLRDPSNTPF